MESGAACRSCCANARHPLARTVARSPASRPYSKRKTGLAIGLHWRCGCRRYSTLVCPRSSFSFSSLSAPLPRARGASMTPVPPPRRAPRFPGAIAIPVGASVRPGIAGARKRAHASGLGSSRLAKDFRTLRMATRPIAQGRRPIRRSATRRRSMQRCRRKRDRRGAIETRMGALARPATRGARKRAPASGLGISRSAKDFQTLRMAMRPIARGRRPIRRSATRRRPTQRCRPKRDRRGAIETRMGALARPATRGARKRAPASGLGISRSARDSPTLRMALQRIAAEESSELLPGARSSLRAGVARSLLWASAAGGSRGTHGAGGIARTAASSRTRTIFWRALFLVASTRA
jgi:hypothetical protein